MAMRIFSASEILDQMLRRSYPAQKSYLAMYSTLWGGVTTDPGLMVVPVDDHLVHRGDGVFEALKLVDGRIYLLQEHLQRLAHSAEQIALPLPMSLDEIKNVIEETVRIAGVGQAVLRLYLARGPGGFTTNPYDSIGAQLYLVVTELVSPRDEKYKNGVTIGRSFIPPKEPWLATNKTCNYLPNVMMKKESVDRQLDFVVGFDDKNFVTEGSTENIVIVDKNKKMRRPRLRQILKGTTMMKCFELAQSLMNKGLLIDIEEADLQEKDILEAQEVMMIGTTIDVLPVVSYEGHPIGSGSPGPVAEALLQLLREDMKKGERCISPAF